MMSNRQKDPRVDAYIDSADSFARRKIDFPSNASGAKLQFTPFIPFAAAGAEAPAIL
jgi:hypothetical protein